MKSHLASDKKERCVNHFHVDQNYFRLYFFNLKAFTRLKRVVSTRNVMKRNDATREKMGDAVEIQSSVLN